MTVYKIIVDEMTVDKMTTGKNDILPKMFFDAKNPRTCWRGEGDTVY